MPFKVVCNDITKVKADAIVNIANPNPICGSGTDLAIFEAAGKEQLLAERTQIGKIARGDVAVTGAYNLNAKYIIHTVGPVWEDGDHHEFDILESCYRKSLQKAVEIKCESIAFPLISTGVYGFPKDKALQIAVSVFGEFLLENDMQWFKQYIGDDMLQSDSYSRCFDTAFQIIEEHNTAKVSRKTKPKTELELLEKASSRSANQQEQNMEEYIQEEIDAGYDPFEDERVYVTSELVFEELVNEWKVYQGGD